MFYNNRTDKMTLTRKFKKEVFKFLNIKIDLRNPKMKNFILNENGKDILQNKLFSLPEYKKNKKNRTLNLDIEYNKDINLNEFIKDIEKKPLVKKERKPRRKATEEELKIRREKRQKNKFENNKKKVQKLAKNYIIDKNDEIIKLSKPDEKFVFVPFDFSKETEDLELEDSNIYHIIILKELFKRIQEIRNFNEDIYIILEFNEKFYTLTDKVIKKLLGLIKGEEGVYQVESDLMESLYKIEVVETPLIFSSYAKTNKNDKKTGAFFKYYNNSNLDLKRYQILKQNDNNEDNNINIDNCLIYALKQVNMNEDKLKIIKNFVNNGVIPICKLKEICEILSIEIILYTEKKSNDNGAYRNKIIYGKSNEKYYICLLEDHYFIYDEKTDYTSYFINNYKNLISLEEIEDKNYIINYNVNEKRYKKDKKRVIDSFDLVYLLLKNKDDLLIKIDNTNINLYDEPYKGFIINENDFNNLDFDEKSSSKKYESINKVKKENKSEKELIIFDFETYEGNNKKHYPYLCSAIYENGEIKTFYGSNCGEQLLKSLKKDCILMAHNAKYDMNFIIKYLYNCNEITNGSFFITFSGYYNKINIQIKDSYKLIASPLKEMPKMFLNEEEIKEIKKEVMPYSFYNKNTINKKYNNINEIYKHLKNDEDRLIFKNNCEKWGLFNNKNEVDIIEYSNIYCQMDCKILKKCYLVFRDWCLNDFNLDINDILTIPSLAERYFKNCGCFDDCYSLSGLPQLFISYCVVGGRTMSSNNQKYKIEDKIINDFDAVSLYPSAMSRIKGFLKGTPKVIKNLNYNDIKDYDGYFIQIKILKVGINRNFSLMSYKTEEGIRDFNNDMIGKIMYVDKTSTEDLINFQGVEFEILKGYYFNDGFNNKIVETINYLFNKRKDLKALGNKSEVIYKLIMNSGYGKLITKPHDKKTIFFNNKNKLDIYISRNYNIINNFIEYDNGKYRVEINEATGNQFNYCHLGSEILSMSKRIMNEVMCLAEDNNLKIYYQDTDSIHIDDKDIKTLSEIYEKKYNRVLIGKNMGQFHSDFNLKVEGVKLKNIVSVGLIILGKKSYIDKLRAEDDNGNYYYDYHIRLKGISNDAIKYKIEQEENYNNAYDLYNDLYNGKKIKFDLTANGSKACFEFNKNYTVSSKADFIREVSF